MIRTFTITQRSGQTHTVYIDEQDKELVSKYTWSIDSGGYAGTNILTPTGQTRLLLHRLLMNLGELVVDHVNRNKLDNRRCNLRVCTHSNNSHNKGTYTNNTTGYRGIVLHRGKYKVQCRLNGTNTHFGVYTTKHAAGIVAGIIRRELHGEYGQGNQVGTLHQLYYPDLVH